MPFLLCSAAIAQPLPSWQKRAAAISRQYAAEFERRTSIFADEVVGEYVNRIGKHVAIQSGSSLPFAFKLYESDRISALTLPGGLVYLSTALLRSAGSESELATILAHQIAHVVNWHMPDSTGYERIPLIWVPLCARLAPASPLIPPSRREEIQQSEADADALAAEYIAKAGYDTNTPGAIVTTSEFVGIQARLPRPETARRRMPPTLQR